MKIKQWLLAAWIAAAGTSVIAQETGDVTVGLGLTTFGVALQGEYTVQPQLNVRGMVMGGFSIDNEFAEEDYTIDGQVNLGGLVVLADYYPMANAWRVSGGIFFSSSELTGDFTGPENFSGKAALQNEIAPMVTTGFRTNLPGGWAVSGDLGVIISSIEVTSDSTDPDVQAEIDTLNSDLGDIPVFPYVGIGVSYSF